MSAGNHATTTRPASTYTTCACQSGAYAAELDALIDTQAAEAEYPQLVHRLRRLREKRRAVRRAG